MLAAFIDFCKTYDIMDRSKLWRCQEDLGLQGSWVGFLRAIYVDLSWEVIVDEEYSEHFLVANGLRQGCILWQMSKAAVGVDSKGWWVPALLHTDDLVLLVEEEILSKELKILHCTITHVHAHPTMKPTQQRHTTTSISSLKTRGAPAPLNLNYLQCKVKF